MRGTKAKRIRREVYGDNSIRDRKYAKDPKTGEVFNMGLRAKYQRAKKATP